MEEDGWTEGWIRKSKLRNPKAIGERVREGVLALKASGHVPGREKLRPGWYLQDLVVLPRDQYLEAYQQSSKKNRSVKLPEAGEGFTNPVTGKMTVRADALQGTVFHEMLHKVSNNALYDEGGRAADEGATEYARMCIQHSGGPPVHANYSDFYGAMTALADAGGDNAKTAILKSLLRRYLTGLEYRGHQARAGADQRRICGPCPARRSY